MRQTMKEIEVNVAYRWFLGLDMMDSVPHFSTFGKNYTRRFKDTDLFEQIFFRIFEEYMKYKLVDTDEIFVDATHVKACANSKKMRKRVAHEQALWYEDELKKLHTIYGNCGCRIPDASYCKGTVVRRYKTTIPV